MIQYLYADQLAQYPDLRKSMFRDRAAQFSGRLNWDVTLNSEGFETDEYDALNPLYVIWQQPDGTHGGSMRFLPTTGRVMVNDHFLHLTDGVTITSPLIWECTRFCLAPNLPPTTPISALLMLAAAELGRRFHLAHAVGVFDSHMVRVYKSIGWEPDILGQSESGRSAISVGIWEFASAPLATIRAKAQVSPQIAQKWFDQAFQSPDIRRKAG
ncbi:MAG: autoinducer synthase [Alphaproteobacteria bacterium]|nr:autoinducer synthase [Alphaproteobacteria bacterium]